MGFQGRSLDDLPLAAYTTGVAPDEDAAVDPATDPAADPDLVAPHPMTQQEIAAALADSVSNAIGPPEKKARRPRASLKLPSLRRSKAAALQQAAPFQPVGAGAPAPSSFQAVSAGGPAAATFQPVASFQATPAFEPVTHPAVAPKPGQPKALKVKRTLPPLSLRDPRILAGGVVVIGLALLGFSLLGGGPAGGSGPVATQDAAAIVPTAPPVGNASVELTGTLAHIYPLTGATGAGPAVESQLNATWTDPAGESLGITGLASQGTRTTDPNFVLSWTMLIDHQSVTFTSRASECTIGMAVGIKVVHGTFVCKNLKSGDGKHEIDMRGTYTT
jgi:hypothetical protein